MDLFFGGPEEIRTPDPYNANVMRSQLRYGPIGFLLRYYTPALPPCQDKSFFAPFLLRDFVVR